MKEYFDYSKKFVFEIINWTFVRKFGKVKNKGIGFIKLNVLLKFSRVKIYTVSMIICGKLETWDY